MRLINYKLKVTELNLIGILKLFRLVFKNIPGIRFEIVCRNPYFFSTEVYVS